MDIALLLEVSVPAEKKTGKETKKIIVQSGKNKLPPKLGWKLFF